MKELYMLNMIENNNRPGADIYEFEVPKWLDDMVKENTIPQEYATNGKIISGGR